MNASPGARNRPMYEPMRSSSPPKVMKPIARAAPRRGSGTAEVSMVTRPSVFHHAAEEQTAKRPVYRVETDEERRPGPELAHGVPNQEQGSGLDGCDQYRNHQGEEQERQQRLACARLVGHGRVQGAG